MGTDSQTETIVDVSQIFWQFVSDVTSMKYARLSGTTGFITLCELSQQSPERGGGFSLSYAALGITGKANVPKPDDDACFDGAGIGYTDDRSNSRVVFRDITSLLRDTVMIVTDLSKKSLLESCLRRMSNFIEVSDLALEIERQQPFA